MATTNNLSISLVEQSQAQKEVTVNAAIIRMDAILNRGAEDQGLSTPPGSPAEGDVYILSATPIGDWAGQANNIAYYNNGVWNFIVPNEGMTIWVNNENRIYTNYGGGWIRSAARDMNDLTDVLITSAAANELIQHNGTAFVNTADVDNLGRVGVNATADATNKLAVKSDAVLFSHDGNNSQVKVDKNATGDTASHLFQTNSSSKAEFGLIGNDDFTLKAGAGLTTSFVIDGTTNEGEIAFKEKITAEKDFAHTGTNVGFYGATPVAQVTGYTTFTNLTTDRTCDANSTTVEELADILGTLIVDLKALGVIGG